MPKKGGKKKGKAPSYLTDAASLDPFGVAVGPLRSPSETLQEPGQPPCPWSEVVVETMRADRQTDIDEHTPPFLAQEHQNTMSQWAAEGMGTIGVMMHAPDGW